MSLQPFMAGLACVAVPAATGAPPTSPGAARRFAAYRMSPKTWRGPSVAAAIIHLENKVAASA
jgi:hypothetical protein